MGLIELRSVTKRYGELAAVDGIDLEVGQGKVTGMRGKNGAGKSTALNMMVGCLAPDDGSVMFDGADLYREPAAVKQSFGYLPETPPLYYELTVNEYLCFACRLHRIHRPQKTADGVMEQLGLGDVRNILIGTLSKATAKGWA
jgi:ABC-2 type transport system ATP-binding protein